MVKYLHRHFTKDHIWRVNKYKCSVSPIIRKCKFKPWWDASTLLEWLKLNALTIPGTDKR